MSYWWWCDRRAIFALTLSIASLLWWIALRGAPSNSYGVLAIIITWIAGLAGLSVLFDVREACIGCGSRATFTLFHTYGRYRFIDASAFTIPYRAAICITTCRRCGHVKEVPRIWYGAAI